MTTLQKQIILLLQKEGPLSRKTLWKRLGVTAAAMSQNIKTMIDDGFIYEDEEIDLKKVGRKEITLRLDRGHYFFLGIELDDLFIVRSNLEGHCELINNKFNSLEDIVKYLKSINLNNCLSISLSKRGFYTIDSLKEKNLINEIKDLCPNVYINNNIACLAYAYKYYHEEATNFMVIKYGPGLGSAAYINNSLLKNENYPTYEIGKIEVDYQGKTLEDEISYQALNITSDNILDKFTKNKDLQEKIISSLAFAIRNSNTLLQLDSIVISGELFQNDKNYELLRNKLSNHSNFNLNKLTTIDNYKTFNKYKSVITGFYLFSK